MVRIIIFTNRFPCFILSLKVHDCFPVYSSSSLLERKCVIVAYILLILRIWALCSDRLFILGDIEINLVYCYPQRYYQWQYLSYFEFLLQNFLCATDYMFLIMRLVFFFFFGGGGGCFQLDKLCLCLHIT